LARLFLGVLNLGITASWLILAVLAVRLLFFKRIPKWVNCLLWGIVALRLLLPVTIESSFSLVPSAQVITDSVLENTNIQTPDNTDILLPPTEYIHSGFQVIDEKVNPVINQSVTKNNDFFQNLLTASCLIWILGITAMVAYAVINYIAIRKRVSSSVPVADNIRKGEMIDSPFVLGLFRPRIYLPYGLSQDTEEYVISHEKAHILRKDHYIKPFAYAILTVYWFNPLVWLAYILLCRDIEYACDECVIKNIAPDERKLYARALLECSVRHPRIAACPVAFGEAGVKERVKKTMTYKKPAFWIIICAVLVCGVVALLFLTAPNAAGDNDYLTPITNDNGTEWYSFEGKHLSGYDGFTDESPQPSYIITNAQELEELVAKQDGTQLAEFASRLPKDFFEKNLLVAVFTYVDGENEDVIMYSAFTTESMTHIDVTLEKHTNMEPVGEKQYKVLVTSISKDKAVNADEVWLVLNEVVYGRETDVSDDSTDKTRVSFFAYVTHTQPLYVDPIEGEGYNWECDKMLVSAAKLEDIMPDLSVGDRVLIEYDGTTFTSDPPMIMAYKVLPMISFEAYVTETGALYVDPIEGTGYDWECDKMQVSTWTLAEIPELSVGDRVLITYDGITLESYPPQMRAYEIVVLEKAE